VPKLELVKKEKKVIFKDIEIQFKENFKILIKNMEDALEKLDFTDLD
jgi:hypothetical protein